MKQVTATTCGSTNRVRAFRQRRKTGTYYLASIPIDWELLKALRDHGLIEFPTTKERVSQLMLSLLKEQVCKLS